MSNFGLFWAYTEDLCDRGIVTTIITYRLFDKMDRIGFWGNDIAFTSILPISFSTSKVSNCYARLHFRFFSSDQFEEKRVSSLKSESQLSNTKNILYV